MCRRYDTTTSAKTPSPRGCVGRECETRRQSQCCRRSVPATAKIKHAVKIAFAFGRAAGSSIRCLRCTTPHRGCHRHGITPTSTPSPRGFVGRECETSVLCLQQHHKPNMLSKLLRLLGRTAGSSIQCLRCTTATSTLSPRGYGGQECETSVLCLQYHVPQTKHAVKVVFARLRVVRDPAFGGTRFIALNQDIITCQPRAILSTYGINQNDNHS